MSKNNHADICHLSNFHQRALKTIANNANNETEKMSPRTFCSTMPLSMPTNRANPNPNKFLSLTLTFVHHQVIFRHSDIMLKLVL